LICARSHTERSIGGTTFRWRERTAGFGQHLVEERRQLVQLDLLCQQILVQLLASLERRFLLLVKLEDCAVQQLVLVL
jgi:hypothetical protein